MNSDWDSYRQPQVFGSIFDSGYLARTRQMMMDSGCFRDGERIEQWRAEGGRTGRRKNEIIDLLGETIKKKTIFEIKDAKYFTIMLDSTRDIGHEEQVSEILRYVHEISK